MFGEMLDNVKAKSPLIHNITNYVTVNDCANILLACGGSPIMADDVDEVEEITTICGGLNINIGTLNKRTIPAMLAAGKKANALAHPVVLDPVGAGASALRTETALKHKTGAIIAITGEIDIVADANKSFCIRNGHKAMSGITGTGCQLSAMTAAYVTANPEHPLTAAAAAVCAMGLCGENARKRMSEEDGNASYRNYIIDAVCNLTAEKLEKGAKYEVR